MTTTVEKSILVNVPVGTVCNQWTQLEDLLRFMGGIKSVKQLRNNGLEWVAEIAAVAAAGAAAVAVNKTSADGGIDDEARLDVGVPLEASPTCRGQAKTEPLDQGDVSSVGGAPSTDVHHDRTGNVANPPENTFSQPRDPK